MKDFIVRFALDHLAVMDECEALGLGISHVTGGLEDDRFVVRIRPLDFLITVVGKLSIPAVGKYDIGQWPAKHSTSWLK